MDGHCAHLFAPRVIKCWPLRIHFPIKGFLHTTQEAVASRDERRGGRLPISERRRLSIACQR